MPREKIVPVDNREFDLDKNLYTITCLKNAFHFDRIMIDFFSLTLVYLEIKDPTLKLIMTSFTEKH